MAVIFDAAADRLLRTTDLLNYNAAYTVMAWVNPTLTSGWNWLTLFALNDDTTSNYDDVFIDENGGSPTICMKVVIGGAGTSLVHGTAPVSGAWVHVAAVRTNASNFYIYVNGVVSGEGTRDITGRAAATRMEIGGFGSEDGDRFVGRMAIAKAWTVAKTASDILQEMRVIRPLNTTGLYGWWPCFPGATERDNDYSGNGHDWTQNGTLTDGDPPPVSWGAPVLNMSWLVAGGGTVYPQSVAGSLSFIGVPVKRTGKVVAGAVTPVGAISRQIGKPMVGNLSPSGFITRATSRMVTGTLSSAGAPTKNTSRALSGVIASAGVLVRQCGKSIAGTLSPGGTLMRASNRLLVGALSFEGVLVRITARALAGSLTSSGGIKRQTQKFLDGVLTPSGSAARQISRLLGGTLTWAGDLVSQFGKMVNIGGILSFGGSIAKKTDRNFGGSLISSGALVRDTGKALVGVLISAGSVAKNVFRSLTGTLSFLGAIVSSALNLPTPDNRIYVIEAESRPYAVAVESRVYTIGAENRIYMVPA